jgi:hypothetical protein
LSAYQSTISSQTIEATVVQQLPFYWIFQVATPGGILATRSKPIFEFGKSSIVSNSYSLFLEFTQRVFSNPTR